MSICLSIASSDNCTAWLVVLPSSLWLPAGCHLIFSWLMAWLAGKIWQVARKQTFLDLGGPETPQLTRSLKPTLRRSVEKLPYKKTIMPNVQITMRTQVTPMVSNYGKSLTKWHVSISKHHVNAWFIYVWAKYLLLQNASNSNVQSITSTSKKSHLLV